MLPEPLQHFLFFPFVEFLDDLVQGKMDHVMVVDFLGSQLLAEA